MTRNIRRSRGYQAERGVCKYLGIERIAGVGRRDGDGGWFTIEVKEREHLPLWLKDGKAQAERLSRTEQHAYLALHELGSRTRDDYLVMRLYEFSELQARLAECDDLRAQVIELRAWKSEFTDRWGGGNDGGSEGS